MADNNVKWIKICTDIFDDEKILLIESMPDADAIIVIWFKLLCMAGKQNNGGVFLLNDKLAYTDEMLATIFRKPLTVVRLALETFQTFGMVDIINNTYCIPNWEKHQSLDALETKREADRIRQAKKREKQKLIAENNMSRDSRVTSHESRTLEREEEKEIDKDIKKEKDKKEKALFYPLDPKLNDAFVEYLDLRKKLKAVNSDRAIKMLMGDIERLSGGDNNRAIELIEQSIKNSWKTVYPLKINFDNAQDKKFNAIDQWAKERGIE